MDRIADTDQGWCRDCGRRVTVDAVASLVRTRLAELKGVSVESLQLAVEENWLGLPPSTRPS